MKKWISVFLVAGMLFSVAGCGKHGDMAESRESSPASGNTALADQPGQEPEGTAESEETLPAAEDTEVDGENGASVVYMTTDISPEGLMAVYEALGAEPSGNVAVKISTGENGSNYLRPELIGELVQALDATIVECNTAYGGQRANTEMHYQLAKDHGYTAIADVDIMDEDGSMTLEVAGGDNLTENYVGARFADYDYYVILSHFKGHAMAGYGGAFKNALAFLLRGAGQLC